MSIDNVIQWQDIFAVVDDGHLQVDDYVRLEKKVVEQAKRCPGGLGCLVILPNGATPPPEPVRKQINQMLERLTGSMRCLAYTVEGTGFKGAAARAALVGMKLFIKRPYPVYVEASLEKALSRMLPNLERGTDRVGEVSTALRTIAEARS